MPVISKFTVGGHPVTKYNNQRLRQFVINGETCPFAKVAESLNGTLPDPISYRIHRLQASGNSSQATGSVPKYICQGASSVLNIGSFIKGDIYSVPITADGITATFSQSNGTYAITGTSSAQGNVLLHNQITLENGHKYLVPTYRDATAAGTHNYFQWGNVYARGIPAANFYWPDQSKAQSWAIVTGNGTAGYCMFNFMNGLDTSVTGFDPSGCFNLIDLTQLYGAGNEPANPETVFQDYPEIPVGNDSWIKNNVIRSISSITLGGQTVSVDLRSAGSVYDEWASNSHGTRRIGIVDLGTLNWQYQADWGGNPVFFTNDLTLAKAPANNDTLANILCAIFSNSTTNDLYAASLDGMTMANNRSLLIRCAAYSDYQDFAAAMSGVYLFYELATSSAFTAGTPLTLASGLTPTDQDGNAVTFTEGTEATPSPNYPVPIVNSSYISITDGQDTNSASIDLAGLTDKDEVFVNVISTNIWNEEYETGRYNNTTGAKEPGDGTRIRNKTPIPCKANQWYYRDKSKVSNIYFYDSNGDFLSYFNDNTVDYFQTPADTAFLCFFTVAGYGTTYKDDINISETSQNVPVHYMPHNTIGKVWHKANTAEVNISTAALSWSFYNNATYASFSGYKKQDINDAFCNAFKARPNNAGIANLISAGEGFAFRKDGTDAIQFYWLGITDNSTTWSNYRANNTIMLRYPLSTPTWSDITSSAMGAALLALETIEETSNTMTINNSGVIDMVQYFTPI